jgi:CheY-like chemotaxis protein
MSTNDLNTSSNSVPADTGAGICIMLVEDDYVSQSLTSIALRKICQVDIAENGRKAVEMAKNKNYRLILMDINLGKGLTGLDTAKLIKELPEYTDTPIIALTAYAMIGDKEEFLAQGCTHYLSKPFDINELISLVRSLL